MFVILGYILALGCVFGGYMLAGGKMGPILAALPVEMMIIGGGALGAFIVTNQPKVLKATFKAIPIALKGSKYTKARYMELLALLYDLLQKARKEGLMAIEQDVENPDQSAIFKKYATISADHHVVEFITDYLRMMVSGNLNAHEIESLMDSEIETHHHEAHAPVAAITRVAGGLPAFGIVAAVLGVIKTMGAINEPPAVLGKMIGGALVGTFLGVLLAYGLTGPLAARLKHRPTTFTARATRPGSVGVSGPRVVTQKNVQPEITLTSTPSLPQDEIMARILFDKSTQQLSAFEAAQLAGAIAERRTGPVVVTAGAEGAYLATSRVAVDHIKAPAVSTVDTTGAGDALVGTFAAALDLGMPPNEALRRGVVAGALACTIVGAQY